MQGPVWMGGLRATTSVCVRERDLVLDTDTHTPPQSLFLLGMDAADAPSCLERSRHTAFMLDNTLFVWGGVQVSSISICAGKCAK